MSPTETVVAPSRDPFEGRITGGEVVVPAYSPGGGGVGTAPALFPFVYGARPTITYDGGTII